MNTNDVERRLESLATTSANPELPLAVLDKLARLEAGNVVTAPLRVAWVPGEHEASKRSVRRFMLLGLAATLTLTGGLVYAVANQNKPNPAPTPPVTLGQWQQIHAFSGSPYDQFESVSLSWQNDEIVGVANGHDKFDLFQSCVLQSKDGTDWTCAELPKPADLCSTDSCASNIEVAVTHGVWVAAGLVQDQGSGGGAALPSATSLTWTSSDGAAWTEQASQRLANYGGAAVLYIYSAPPTDLLATRYGFVRGGAVTGTLAPGANVLMTSTDGTSWQPARMSAGSMPMSSAALAASPNGYLAVGICQLAAASTRFCAARSPDGETWTTSYPAASAASGLGDRLQAAGKPAFFGGQWVVSMATMADFRNTNTIPSDSGYYEAVSADGLNWTIDQRPSPSLLQNAFSDYGTYYPAYSQPGSTGEWAISGAGTAGTDGLPTFPIFPKEEPHTYWSQSGDSWHQVGPGPEGYPLALVETPTEVIAFIATYPDGTGANNYPSVIPTVSVWAATKH
jgi:hypothetical protein